MNDSTALVSVCVNKCWPARQQHSPREDVVLIRGDRLLYNLSKELIACSMKATLLGVQRSFAEE